jgi:hypothetical protein
LLSPSALPLLTPDINTSQFCVLHSLINQVT